MFLIFTQTIEINVSHNKKQVSNGHELFPSFVSSKPRVEIHGGYLRSFFTLLDMCADTGCEGLKDKAVYSFIKK
ncbi:unnamed protein product [Eruca vesicaria subsp. sativa]|uniref:Uncharacterized protein n=1 Tax=Eruca vesicaria subsp. sativa TaxID=29727 RepID=A0ABC8LF76_ERUVS|nr:unnamed protein product [Eruca vesicaria subsp. sativa]